MGDDRTDAYRMLFATTELSRIFNEYKDTAPIGYIAYQLLLIRDAHPTESHSFVIKTLKHYLDERKPRTQDNES